MTLGQRTKERRQLLGITQQELAAATRITLRHVSAIEQDKRNPSLPVLIKLAGYLNTSLDYLALGKEANMDLMAAIKADDRLDAEMKKPLIHLVTIMHNARKSKDSRAKTRRR
jgi:transcriptional regulator with XRE-family HTH domain